MEVEILPDDDKIVSICAWCKSLMIDGKLTEIKLPKNKSLLITHAICANCLEKHF